MDALALKWQKSIENMGTYFDEKNYSLHLQNINKLVFVSKMSYLTTEYIRSKREIAAALANMNTNQMHFGFASLCQ